jgi:hypothetical protein
MATQWSNGVPATPWYEAAITRDDIVAFFRRRGEGLHRHGAALLGGFHPENRVVDQPVCQWRCTGARRHRARLSGVLHVLQQLGIQAGAVANRRGQRGGSCACPRDEARRSHGLPPTERPFSILLVPLCDMREGFVGREQRISDFTGQRLQVGASSRNLPDMRGA